MMITVMDDQGNLVDRTAEFNALIDSDVSDIHDEQHPSAHTLWMEVLEQYEPGSADRNRLVMEMERDMVLQWIMGLLFSCTRCEDLVVLDRQQWDQVADQVYCERCWDEK